MVWRRAGNPGVRHPVDVIRTIDGDTFEARVHLSPGLDPTTRVRLRGIDAPELKAACPQELQMAEAAGAALRGLLGEGGVTIYNIGPDKYNGRVVADAATRRTDNVSAALLAAGHARGYRGGRRSAWCCGLIPQTKKPRMLRGFRRIRSGSLGRRWISGSRPPSCRPRRADRGR